MTSQSTTLTALPTELQLKILHSFSPPESRNRALATLSRTSQTLHALAHRELLLYPTIHIGQLKGLLNAYIRDKLVLASKVRTLTLFNKTSNKDYKDAIVRANEYAYLHRKCIRRHRIERAYAAVMKKSGVLGEAELKGWHMVMAYREPSSLLATLFATLPSLDTLDLRHMGLLGVQWIHHRLRESYRYCCYDTHVSLRYMLARVASNLHTLVLPLAGRYEWCHSNDGRQACTQLAASFPKLRRLVIPLHAILETDRKFPRSRRKAQQPWLLLPGPLQNLTIVVESPFQLCELSSHLPTLQTILPTLRRLTLDCKMLHPEHYKRETYPRTYPPDLYKRLLIGAKEGRCTGNEVELRFLFEQYRIQAPTQCKS
jgi:hypothetical protein